MGRLQNVGINSYFCLVQEEIELFVFVVIYVRVKDDVIIKVFIGFLCMEELFRLFVIVFLFR